MRISNENSFRVILDSGANHHYFGNRKWFTDFVYHVDHVKFADNSKASITGVGNVKLRLKNNFILVLKNVYFVPSFKNNLISQSLLFEENIITRVVSLANESLVYYDQDLLFDAKINNGMPCIDVYEDFHALSATNQQLMLHEKFGHPGVNNTKKIREIFQVPIDVIDKCETCKLSKLKSLPYNSSDSISDAPLELIHFDICGPIEESYDNFKSQIFDIFVQYKNFIENQLDKRIKAIRSDNAREFLSKKFQSFLIFHGIQHQKSVPYCHQQNGVAERSIQKMTTIARSLLVQSNAPLRLWAQAIGTAVHIANRTPHQKINDIPFRRLFNKLPGVNHFHVFGSKVFVLSKKNSKFSKVARKHVFVGYSIDSKAYKIFDPITKSIFIERNVNIWDGDYYFNDDDSMKNAKLFVPSLNNGLQDDDNCIASIPILPPINDHVDTNEENNNSRVGSRLMRRVDPSLIIDDHRRYPLRQTERISDEHINMFNCDDIKIPRNFNEAIESNQKNEWLDAMNEELKSFNRNQVYEEINESECTKKPLSSRWVFTIKKDQFNRIEKFKARFVMRGDGQQEGIDFHEIFSPVVNMTTLRIALTLAAAKNFSLSHIDVKTAYLHADLDELIYVKPPPGFAKDGKLWKLRKSVYGLKQSARNWFNHLNNLLKTDFIQSKNDSCLYIHKQFDLFMLVYVDDFLIGYKQQKDFQSIYEFLSKNLSLRDLGEPKKFCGFEINKNDGNYHLSQSTFIQQLAEEFGVSSLARFPKTPLQTFDIDEKSPIFEDGSLCRRLIGSIQYLTRTRPDVTASINALSVKMQSPTVQIWNGAKRVLSYLMGTRDRHLVLGNFKNEALEIYTDADHANSPSRKSVSGVLIKIFGSSVFWSSSRQKCVAVSTAESEFYAMSCGLSEGLWVQRILEDFGIVSSIIPLYVDNKSSIKIAENGPLGDSKHIDTRAHAVKDYIDRGFVKLSYLKSELMLADFLTKPFNLNMDKLLNELCSYNSAVFTNTTKTRRGIGCSIVFGRGPINIDTMVYRLPNYCSLLQADHWPYYKQQNGSSPTGRIGFDLRGEQQPWCTGPSNEKKDANKIAKFWPRKFLARVRTKWQSYGEKSDRADDISIGNVKYCQTNSQF
ncbi:hypothetical protein DERF_005036 [Dermatophagoides farinae]|uniref:Integrase catalytic domain-containing protein n=1 Tax=Dermatophagoides farinae TaxID=6954 RepID=A0A922I4H4_DERFA|nr:hypothetical protein DERF_005036 [Dermatophagoides farinae]